LIVLISTEQARFVEKGYRFRLGELWRQNLHCGRTWVAVKVASPQAIVASLSKARVVVRMMRRALEYVVLAETRRSIRDMDSHSVSSIGGIVGLSEDSDMPNQRGICGRNWRIMKWQETQVLAHAKMSSSLISFKGSSSQYAPHDKCLDENANVPP
jgi:hypothetical protein